MFKKYDRSLFKKLRKQHNIFVLVGNGFDVSILKKFQSKKLPGKTTKYDDFFDYISYFNLSSLDNLLYRKMREEYKIKDNWSDFENTIGEILDSSDNYELEKSVDEFQALFTRFLNDLIDTDILLQLDREVAEKELSIQSLGSFLKDIDTKNGNRLKFMESIDHYDLYNFTFANFNYTPLLDNYIYLDKFQFDPHIHKTVDTNFRMKHIYSNTTEDGYSSYLVSQVIHPHGIQSIPRSILFGIYLDNCDEGRGSEKRFVKGYWSQYDVKYKSYLEEADLFIIYGMSLGLSDAWWFDNIYKQILNRGVELIIYMHGSYVDAIVKELFIHSCLRHRKSDYQEKETVKKNIYVVTFETNNTYFLGLENKSHK
ncbi:MULTISPECIES: AbiH family protein [Aerococcus]|uniref:AbiH family protein n=1 Tax=Aerococcus TaxID=1375 RepID=UPI000DCE78B3|nr:MULTISPECIES: AbiH family protein [Aerococcus]KAA9220804.1 ABC transporter permease [Aerococcus loyolae]KAA9265752.1 ABC transporter permease [Aerococcus loyolae]MCY3084066.1 bacteriophage abortive infection AbiH family protein [Aerococcus mictus]MDK6231531.1 AbiH family protein [Aerococcus urinae]MDK6257529.1 AbiH family protein [Aerococcus urinae]